VADDFSLEVGEIVELGMRLNELCCGQSWDDVVAALATLLVAGLKAGYGSDFEPYTAQILEILLEQLEDLSVVWAGSIAETEH